jgi:hypothetical protein
MAGGGQKGASFLGENNVWISVLTALVILLLGFGPRACDFEDDPTPIEQHAEDCETAWSDNEKGAPDEEAKTLVTSEFCDAHNQAAIATVKLEDQQKFAEAQDDVQEAQTP